MQANFLEVEEEILWVCFYINIYIILLFSLNYKNIYFKKVCLNKVLGKAFDIHRFLTPTPPLNIMNENEDIFQLFPNFVSFFFSFFLFFFFLVFFPPIIMKWLKIFFLHMWGGGGFFLHLLNYLSLSHPCVLGTCPQDKWMTHHIYIYRHVLYIYYKNSF